MKPEIAVRPWTLSSAIRGPNLNLSPFAFVLSPSPTRFLNFILCFVYFIYLPRRVFCLLSLLSLTPTVQRFPAFLIFFFRWPQAHSHIAVFFSTSTSNQHHHPPFEALAETRTASLILYKQNTFTFFDVLCLKIYKMLLLMLFFYIYILTSHSIRSIRILKSTEQLTYALMPPHHRKSVRTVNVRRVMCSLCFSIALEWRLSRESAGSIQLHRLWTADS